MSDMTNATEQTLLNAMLRGVAFTSPSNVYIGLFTTAPTETTDGTEVTDTAYTRQEIIFGPPTEVDGQITCKNTNLVEFPPSATAYGSVVAIGIFTDKTDGSLMLYKALASEINITVGTGLLIQIGDLSISLD